MRCNTYEAGNALDWAINPETQTGILGPQGTGCGPTLQYRAGNVFDDATNDNIRGWIQPFDYYYPNITNQTPVFVQLELNPMLCQGITSGDGSCDTQPFTMNPDPPEAMYRLAQQDSILDELGNEMDTALFYIDSTFTDTLLAHIADTNYSNAT